MLFLVFLHKITPNCKVKDYKTTPFRIITYSLLLHTSFIQIKQIDGIHEGVDGVYLVRGCGAALGDAAQVGGVVDLHGAVAEAPWPQGTLAE